MIFYLQSSKYNELMQLCLDFKMGMGPKQAEIHSFLLLMILKNKEDFEHYTGITSNRLIRSTCLKRPMIHSFCAHQQKHGRNHHTNTVHTSLVTATVLDIPMIGAKHSYSLIIRNSKPQERVTDPASQRLSPLAAYFLWITSHCSPPQTTVI